MTNERYKFLEKHLDAKLSPEELSQGWHFCDEWDYLLVGPGMSELAHCSCELSEAGIIAREEAKKKDAQEMEAQYNDLTEDLLP